jgi:hypothetical protein
MNTQTKKYIAWLKMKKNLWEGMLTQARHSSQQNYNQASNIYDYDQVKSDMKYLYEELNYMPDNSPFNNDILYKVDNSLVIDYVVSIAVGLQDSWAKETKEIDSMITWKKRKPLCQWTLIKGQRTLENKIQKHMFVKKTKTAATLDGRLG